MQDEPANITPHARNYKKIISTANTDNDKTKYKMIKTLQRKKKQTERNEHTAEKIFTLFYKKHVIQN